MEKLHSNELQNELIEMTNNNVNLQENINTL